VEKFVLLGKFIAVRQRYLAKAMFQCRNFSPYKIQELLFIKGFVYYRFKIVVAHTAKVKPHK
jgi:hypothetical protein